MQAGDLHAAADLHKARFSHAWNDGAFHSLLNQETVFGFVAKQTSLQWGVSTLGGFVLSRAAAGEAEILTVGVDLRFERQGLGWRLMRAAMGEARHRGVESMFLEVDETNGGAVGLYQKLGFFKVGERNAYYKSGDGRRSTALVMKLDLR
ncbi:N-acetyltransferase [Pararhizobium sp.]|uniref:N-acetyltransferase n=1 Tax=Pararhizobium sp. TaxID=1977563 RepID=UPI002722FB5E|nr:N-acetyltransferase [Pararhizobium sp.]MDO9417735.1 N-acetyltransferase [Pararhizobium sp.]